MRIKFFILLFFISLRSFALEAVKTIPNDFHKILLVAVDYKELKDTIAILKMKKLSTSFPYLPFYSYYTQIGGKSIYLIFSGIDPVNKVENVGTQAGALATYAGIRQFNPDLVISIGSAGGVRANNIKQNQIIISSMIKFYARRFSTPKFREYGLGNYDTSFIKSNMDIAQNFKFGTVCSGDSFDNDMTDSKLISQENCDVIDMEAAGVAWAALLSKKPVLAFKVITNYYAVSDALSTYRSDLEIASRILGVGVKKFIEDLKS